MNLQEEKDSNRAVFDRTPIHPDEEAKVYKYTIWRKMQNLTIAQRKLAKLLLPKRLGVRLRTFETWMYYKIGEEKTVPADSLYQLSTFFGCSVHEMWTETPESLHLESLKVKQISK